MKPLGRKYYKDSSKKDVHPLKGWINWWEDVCVPNKSAEKRDYMEQIKEWAEEFESRRYILTPEEIAAMNSDEYFWLVEHQNELD